MVVSFARNGADLMDGSLVKFESAADFGCFTVSSAIWDSKAKCLQSTGEGTVIESPVIEVEQGFDNLIASWNAIAPLGSYLTVQAQARFGGDWTKWYTMAIWNRGGCKQHRTSVKGQEDEHGTVACDVLKLKKSADAFRLRVELASDDGVSYPGLKFLAANVIDSSVAPAGMPPVKSVWGTELDVPALCQISVEGGRGWCSPTSTAMLLSYWSRELKRPELKTGVTESAQNCHDEAWGGTGNWPFNTAFAGSHDGIRAYVTRFASVSQIERWIEKGIPVIVSLHSSKLRREDSDTDPGHLMVIRGFTSEGDPVFNDPWPRNGNGDDDPREYPFEDLRKVFKREDLEYAWLGPSNSSGTVYLIYPENA